MTASKTALRDVGDSSAALVHPHSADTPFSFLVPASFSFESDSTSAQGSSSVQDMSGRAREGRAAPRRRRAGAGRGVQGAVDSGLGAVAARGVQKGQGRLGEGDGAASEGWDGQGAPACSSEAEDGASSLSSSTTAPLGLGPDTWSTRNSLLQRLGVAETPAQARLPPSARRQPAAPRPAASTAGLKLLRPRLGDPLASWQRARRPRASRAQLLSPPAVRGRLLQGLLERLERLGRGLGRPAVAATVGRRDVWREPGAPLVSSAKPYADEQPLTLGTTTRTRSYAARHLLLAPSPAARSRPSTT